MPEPGNALRPDPAAFERIAREDLAALLARRPIAGLQGKRMLITGGTGFFGQWLLSALALMNEAGAGIEVVLTSRDPRRAFADRPSIAGAPWVRIVRCDLACDPLPPGPFDAILHGAADTSTQAASDPLGLYAAITEGARKILRLASDTDCERVLLLSSGAVYARQEASDAALTEDSPCGGDPRDTGNAYAEGKRAMETLAACTARAGGARAVIARCFAFAGPGLPLDGHFALGNFIRNALLNQPIRINGSGQAVRSYLYAADMAVWLLALLGDAPPQSTWHVGSDRGLTIAELAERVRDTLNPGLPVEILGLQHQEARPRYLPSIAKARRELALEAWTTLDRAIERTAAQFMYSAKAPLTGA